MKPKSGSFDRPERRDGPPFLFAALVLGGIALSRFFAVAASPGEIDEAVFAGAVTRFDLFDLSPQAPGFPLWILIGRALTPATRSPFAALALASTLLSALAFPALYAWGRRLVGGWAALSGTLLAASLPVVWVNGGRAFSDSPSTACFVIALALLAAADEARISHDTRREETASGRRVRLLAIGAGLFAAAGAGIRPHLVLAFLPVLLLGAARLARRGERHDAAVSFLVSGLAGTLALLAWLFAQAGGTPGLFASLSERTGFRSHAFATGTFGALASSFLVRDFLSWRRAALVLGLALLGLAALVVRRSARLLDLLLVLVPAFLSLWLLHSRAMSRYSVPFVLVLSLAVGAGLASLLRRGHLAFAASLGLAALFARDAWPEVRWGAREETPPMAAIHLLERYVHPGRETIVADDDFQAFLRTERWEGRLVAWGYLDSEILAAPRGFNKRLVRLADLTDEVDPPDRTDPVWRSFYHGGRVAEALGNGRLLAVGLRDPAPPLFGPGFGVRERLPGLPSFRWCGPSGHLLVPGLEGPPVALLSGERPGDAGATTLRVTDAATGRLVLSRRIEPGPFELAIVPEPVFGPLPRPSGYVVSCDVTKPLPPVEGAARPREGCFVFRDATLSIPPETIWERQGGRRLLDIGSPRDRFADPVGFYPRERVEALSVDTRWTGASASVAWVPVAGFFPHTLALRARPPSTSPVDVGIRIGGVPSGRVRVLPGGLAESRLTLPPAAAAALAGGRTVRIELTSPTFSPKRAGTGADPRELGVAVDRIALE